MSKSENGQPAVPEAALQDREAFHRLMSSVGDVVADEVRDAFDESDDVGEVARRLRSAERDLSMLADMAEAVAEDTESD